MLIEPHGDLVDAAFAHFRDKEMNYNMDPRGPQENEDSIDHSEKIEESNSIGETDSRHSIYFPIITSNLENLSTNDDGINDSIRSLNTKRIYIFDYVYKWARDYLKISLVKFPRR